MHNIFFGFHLIIADRAIRWARFDINISTCTVGCLNGDRMVMSLYLTCLRVILLLNIWLCFDFEHFQWKILLLHFMKWKFISDKNPTTIFLLFFVYRLCIKFEIFKYVSILFHSYINCEFIGFNERGFSLILITSIAFLHFNNIADSSS